MNSMGLLIINFKFTIFKMGLFWTFRQNMQIIDSFWSSSALLLPFLENPLFAAIQIHKKCILPRHKRQNEMNKLFRAASIRICKLLCSLWLEEVNFFLNDIEMNTRDYFVNIFYIDRIFTSFLLRFCFFLTLNIFVCGDVRLPLVLYLSL